MAARRLRNMEKSTGSKRERGYNDNACKKNPAHFMSGKYKRRLHDWKALFLTILPYQPPTTALNHQPSLINGHFLNLVRGIKKKLEGGGKKWFTL